MKEMKKWKIVALCTVLACLAIVASGTLAYFTASETAHNVITSGGVAIQLIEQTQNEDGSLVPWKNVGGVMPGAEISKIVTVKNTGASDAWVRIKVEKTITLARGVQGTPDLSLVRLDINTEDWTEQGGYYYYNHSLKPGETTKPLFKTVTFAPEMGNMYQNSKADIVVQADAVQVANNGASATVAAGWPKSK